MNDAHHPPGAGKTTAYQRLLNAEETRHGEMKLTVRFPTIAYLNEFVGLKCAPDMLSLGLFPNAKEVTESVGCYRAVTRHVEFLDRKNPRVMVVVVGDGSTPRTGAMFAFRSAWSVLSVDPVLRPKVEWLSIRRLVTIPTPVASLTHRGRWDVKALRANFDHLVVVCPHSHAAMRDVVRVAYHTEMPFSLVVMPCCVGDVFDEGVLPAPAVEYDDWNVWSPSRHVMVWPALAAPPGASGGYEV